VKVILAGLIAGSCSLAQAVPIMITDQVLPSRPVLVNANNRVVRFVHDIRDDGYNPETDSLTSAELALVVRDDARTEMPFPLDTPSDPMVVVLDGVFDAVYEVNLRDILIAVSVSALQRDGMLTVTLGLPRNAFRDWDWRIGGSTLSVTAERSASNVPAPGTALMVIGGLLLLLLRAGIEKLNPVAHRYGRGCLQV
jgi:hypothetical protein